jgi:hypothetical protein
MAKLFNPLPHDSGEVIPAHFVGEMNDYGWAPEIPFDPDGEGEKSRLEKLRSEFEAAQPDLVMKKEFELAATEIARDNRRKIREAYLTSDEGRQEAAERFESLIGIDDLEDPEPIIEGFLYRDTVARTFGPPKSLKSFVTLDMAACVSLGIPWQGVETTQQTVLYVVAEGGRGMRKRKLAWNEHHGTDMKVLFYPRPVQLGKPEEMYDLISFCMVKQVGYVVIDTQARCTVGVNENDNTEMGEIVASCDILKQQTGACVHLVHHSVGNDDSRARGATAWDGAVDSEFAVKRDTRDRTQVKMVSKFQKDEGEADDVEMETREVGMSLVLVGGSGSGGGGVDAANLPPVTEGLLPYLNVLTDYQATGATQKELVEQTGRDKSTVSRNVNKLAEFQVVELKGSKIVLTELGWQVLRWRSRHEPATQPPPRSVQDPLE